MKYFKHLLFLLVVGFGLALAACGSNSKNPHYEELKKSGKIHDAQIIAIDSVNDMCTYMFRFHAIEYTGMCKQPKDKPFQLDQLILIVFLERDPTISIRFSEK